MKKSVNKNEKIDVLEILYNPKVRLTKIEGDRTSIRPKPDEELAFHNDWNYEIISNEKDEISIETKCKVFFDNDVYFKIAFVFLLTYDCDKEVPNSEIEACIEDVLQPCANHASMMIAILTDKMMGSPLVLPPTINLKK